MSKSFLRTPKLQQTNLDEATGRKQFVDQLAHFEKHGAGTDHTGRGDKVPMQRMTFDIPKSLHTEFKIVCSKHSLRMRDEVEKFIRQRIAELEES